MLVRSVSSCLSYASRLVEDFLDHRPPPFGPDLELVGRDVLLQSDHHHHHHPKKKIYYPGVKFIKDRQMLKNVGNATTSSRILNQTTTTTVIKML